MISICQIWGDTLFWDKVVLLTQLSQFILRYFYANSLIGLRTILWTLTGFAIVVLKLNQPTVDWGFFEILEMVSKI